MKLIANNILDDIKYGWYIGKARSSLKLSQKYIDDDELCFYYIERFFRYLRKALAIRCGTNNN